jgi:hypothetical protein
MPAANRRQRGITFARARTQPLPPAEPRTRESVRALRDCFPAWHYHGLAHRLTRAKARGGRQPRGECADARRLGVEALPAAREAGPQRDCRRLAWRLVSQSDVHSHFATNPSRNLKRNPRTRGYVGRSDFASKVERSFCAGRPNPTL